MHPDTFDPFSLDTVQDPYAFYASMRQHAPVYQPKGCDYHCVARFEDVKTVVLDPETYSSNIVGILLRQGTEHRLFDVPSLPGGPVDVLAIADPPHHKAQRQAVTRVLSRSWVRALEPAVRATAGGLLDQVQGDSFNFMEDVAFRLPIAVVGDSLGVAPSDRAQVKDWSDHAIALLSGVNTAESLAGHAMAGLTFHAYATTLTAAEPRTELMAALHAARDAGDLNAQELASIAMQLLIAGSDSSASAMGSAVRLLGTRPELQRALRADPSKIGLLVEEVLRLETPFQGHFRVARRDTELAGVALPEGARVMLLWASANRDPTAFDLPDQVQLDRARPSRHLAFGHGLHHCLGAELARLEVRVVLELMLERFEGWSIEGPRVYRNSVFVRTLEALRVRPQ
jgi:cytochrome P450 family 144